MFIDYIAVKMNELEQYMLNKSHEYIEWKKQVMV